MGFSRADLKSHCYRSIGIVALTEFIPLIYGLSGDVLACDGTTFVYDGAGRLTSAESVSGHSERGISYYRNGNILGLERTAGGDTVDDLVYFYEGNQLIGLEEGIGGSPAGDVYEQRGSSPGAYWYDANGNMVLDTRRGLEFRYNFLNLLSDVRSSVGVLIADYYWLADGTKLRVCDVDGRGFDYVGSLIYGPECVEARFSGGVIRDGDGQDIDYFLTDHLGPVRAVVDSGGRVLQRSDYYGFGSRHVFVRTILLVRFIGFLMVRRFIFMM